MEKHLKNKVLPVTGGSGSSCLAAFHLDRVLCCRRHGIRELSVCSGARGLTETRTFFVSFKGVSLEYKNR